MNTTRALVTGGGGVVGTAWMTGLVSGLRRAGVDLAEADVIVGTSAGSIVGTMLATGQDFDSDTPAPPGNRGDSAPQADRGRLAEVFAILADASLEPADARRQVGQVAIAAQTITEQAHIAGISMLITAQEWPDRQLLITAVDVETGELKVWDRAGDAPLRTAVASSCALPGVSPPITVNGRRYMDGGIGSGTNADVATGADVLVLLEPLAHLFPRGPLERELAAAGAGTVVTINPDQAALDAFGPDLGDWAAWQPAREAGIRQAAATAERVRAAWSTKDR
ncbi:NTE family protein [Streptacidiphilus sp. MAP12-16]|uniref:patatin-like phospholipase family protein n=1 Tax=Streptacidiphilus sp. MAP12-16 TaxID=3156300 RepID=UPI003512DE08